MSTTRDPLASALADLRAAREALENRLAARSAEGAPLIEQLALAAEIDAARRAVPEDPARVREAGGEALRVLFAEAEDDAPSDTESQPPGQTGPEGGFTPTDEEAAFLRALNPTP